MPPPDLSKLLTLGEKMNHFQAVVEGAANDLEADHPQKELVQRLASMLKAQHAAIGDAFSRFHQAAGEQLASSKTELDAAQKEFAATREKMQGILDAAKAGMPPPGGDGKGDADKANGKPAAPAAAIDPNFGKNLARELLEKYLAARKQSGTGFQDREIWQDWT